jgi:Vitamin K-dependent gamma-carboxylase.
MVDRHNNRIDPIVRRWEHFWFRGIPPDLYAVLRILFAAYGFISLLGVSPSLFWSLEGIVSISQSGLGIKERLLDLGMGAAAGYAFYAAVMLGFIGAAIGFRTAWSVPACFVLSVLQVFWNGLPLSSAHSIMTSMFFCLMWADCGAVWSIDAWLARLRDVSQPPPSSPIWPLRLMRFQVALIYLNSGLWKLFSDHWRDGSALHYVLNHNVFRRFPYEIPAAFDPVLTVLTYTTLLWELSFPFLLLRPATRRLALGIGVMLHLGIWATLEVGPFTWGMLATYVAFADPDKLSRLSKPQTRLQVRELT